MQLNRHGLALGARARTHGLELLGELLALGVDGLALGNGLFLLLAQAFRGCLGLLELLTQCRHLLRARLSCGGSGLELGNAQSALLDLLRRALLGCTQRRLQLGCPLGAVRKVSILLLQCCAQRLARALELTHALDRRRGGGPLGC